MEDAEGSIARSSSSFLLPHAPKQHLCQHGSTNRRDASRLKCRPNGKRDSAFVSMANRGASGRIAGAVGFNAFRQNRWGHVQSAAASLLLYIAIHPRALPVERRRNAVDPGCRGLVINNERAGTEAFVSMAERVQGASPGSRGQQPHEQGRGGEAGTGKCRSWLVINHYQGRQRTGVRDR
jgi:hypothetical protein